MPLRTLGTILLLLPTLARAEDPGGFSPAESLARMEPRDGFHVDLLAAEPDVVQPIALCFDPRGRLWVAEGNTYPTRAKEGEGRDRILVLADDDGNGRYESRKVFAEGLNLVSGIQHGFGGLFVGAAPHLLFIPDADGDEIPDGEPEVLLDGWGWHDTHETLNSFTWGPDGWLYGCHGVFTHSRVGRPGTPDDQRIPINAGVWRFHPVRREFEVFAHGTSNPWGIDFNDWGEAFVEACVIPHLWHIIPGGVYHRQAGEHFNPHVYEDLKTIADHRHWAGNIGDHAHWGGREGGDVPQDVSEAGGGHAHSGFAICLSHHFPPEFRNGGLMFNIHGHRMNHDAIGPRGSGWTGSHRPDLLLANDPWFIGVGLQAGPGGAYYFSDWQDDTSCHRTDPLRWDRSNGRLYRLRYGKLRSWEGDLAKLPDLELARLQAGEDEWQLRIGRRLLQERASLRAIDRDALESLRRTLAEHPDPTRRLRALWSLAACDALDPETLRKDPEERIRAWAVRLDAEDGELSPGILALAAQEDSPVVRLALCSAMQRVGPVPARGIASALASQLDPDDPNLTPMFWLGIERRVNEAPDDALELALGCPDDRLLRWTARRLEGADSVRRLMNLLGDGRKPDSLVLDVIRRRLADHPGESVGDSRIAELERLATAGPEEARDFALRLAVSAGSRTLRPVSWRLAGEDWREIGGRQSHLRSLANHWQEGDQERLLALLESRALRLDVLELCPALLALPGILERLPGLEPAELHRLLRLACRSGHAGLAVDAFVDGRFRPADMPADLLTSLRNTPDPELAAKLEKVWPRLPPGSADAATEIAKWKKRLTPEALARADAARGRVLFDRTCASCHKLFGEGGDIGPELTGGDRTNLDHWLDNTVTPNALIGAGYELIQIEHDAKVSVGMAAHEDDATLTLRMVGNEERIAKARITARRPLGISMMPEGLLATLRDEEVRDLISYLMAPRQVARPE